jgi:beta-lactamase regulating signal transducer with metallopeptidase domain
MSPATIHASWSFLAGLGNAAARSLVLAGFVAAALSAFRVRNVRIKLLAWKGLLAISLAMPFLILLAPAIPVSVPVPSLPQYRAKAATMATTHAFAGEPVGASERFAESAQRVAKQSHSDRVQARLAAAQPAALASPAPHRKIPWLLLVLCAYGAVAIALLTRVFVGMRFGTRLASSATLVSDAEALLLLSATSQTAGLPRDPELRESDALCVPLMLGVLRPAILLPSDWRKWEDGELEAVLAHEVSHVERNDALAQRLALIHRAIFWFSPLAWWLERHLDELAEQASDEAALSAGADRTRYAETLLGFFAELEAGPERVWWQGVSMAKAGQAEKRVDRILAWRGAMSNRLKKSLVAVLVAIAAPIVAFTAAARPAAQDVERPPAPVAPPPVFAQAAPDAVPSPARDPAQAPAPPSAPAPDSAAAQAPPPPPPSVQQAPAHDEIWINVPALNLPQVTVPPIHIELPPIPPAAFSMSGDWNAYRTFGGGYYVGRYSDWGPRFVIVTKDSDAVTMSGDRQDAEHATSLRSRIPGEFIWFERDGKSYVIQDQATVDRAKKLWSSENDVAKQEEALRKKEEDLGKQMRDEVQQKLDGIRVQIPDLSAQLEKLQADAKNLSASGATLQQLGDLQREIGDLQRIVGQTDWEVGIRPAEIGRQAGELGRQMGELGRQIGEAARQAAERARDASREMKGLLDDAIARGLAKPE